MSSVHQFPRQCSRLYGWADEYVGIWSTEGWLPASKFIKENVPEQLWLQVGHLIQREMLKRGIQVEF